MDIKQIVNAAGTAAQQQGLLVLAMQDLEEEQLSYMYREIESKTLSDVALFMGDGLVLISGKDKETILKAVIHCLDDGIDIFLDGSRVYVPEVSCDEDEDEEDYIDGTVELFTWSAI